MPDLSRAGAVGSRRLAAARLAVLAFLAAAASSCQREPQNATLALATVRTWELSDALAAVALSRDATAVALGSATGESSLWNSPWTLSVIFDRAPSPLVAAAFDAEDHLLFARSDGSFQVLASTGAVIQEGRFADARGAARAEFSSSGAHVAFDGRLYALAGERALAPASTPPAPSSAVFAGDGTALIVDRASGELSVQALQGGVARTLRASSGITAAAISANGRSIAVATIKDVQIWQDDELEPSCRHATGEAASALAFSGSARWLALAGGRALEVVRVSDCERLASLRSNARVTSLVVHEDLIAAGDESGHVYVWDVYNARWLAREQVFDAAVLQVQLHASSRSVLAASNRGRGAEAKLLRVAP